MAGVYVQRDTTDGVHMSPANVVLEGVSDLSLRVTEDHLGMLNADSVNSFRVQRGVRPWGARTASSDPSWRYVPVRRLFVMLRRTLEKGFAWATFESNNHYTWDAIDGQARRFLAGLWERGMLVGGKAEDAFFVQCDAETNPPENVDGGLLTCNIAVAPVSPAEFIMVSLVQRMAGSDANE
jgi:phage tail sheath protein FI